MRSHDYTALFDGTALTGGHATPRLYSARWAGGPSLSTDTAEYREQAVRHAARWSVEDGASIGAQWSPGSGFGGVLVVDTSFAGFEPTMEARPVWPSDTHIYLRKTEGDWSGIQVLLDHRRSGGIGGFYGNGIGDFTARPFAVQAVGEDRRPTEIAVGDTADDSLQPWDAKEKELLTYAASPDEFLTAWRWGDWNEFRVRCVGMFPTIAVGINGVKISEIDFAHLEHPYYDKQRMLEKLGRSGPIAFEVHENDPGMGEQRWEYGAKARWCNVRVLDLSNSVDVAQEPETEETA